MPAREVEVPAREGARDEEAMAFWWMGPDRWAGPACADRWEGISSSESGSSKKDDIGAVSKNRER